MTSLKTSIKTITYLSDIGCLEIQGASLAGKLLYLFQKGNRLAGERYDMRSTHFCATPRKPNFVDGLAGGGDGPDFVPEIDLAPAGETQFAGTDEQVQCQHLRQPG